jgi:hypothetical protein
LASLLPADGSHFSKPRIAKSSFPPLRNAYHAYCFSAPGYGTLRGGYAAPKRLGGFQVKAKVLILAPVVVAGLFVFSSALWAHHASRQVYEGKSIMLMGVVTDYEWANPHSVLSIAVKDNKGKVEEWHAEILPPSEMLRAGWTKESLKPGDEVTLTGRPGRYEQHIMWLEFLVTSDGKKLGRKP